MYQNRKKRESREKKKQIWRESCLCIAIRIPRSGWLKQQTFTLFQLWRPEVQDQVSVSSSLFFGISSSSYKVNNQIGLGRIVAASSS